MSDIFMKSPAYDYTPTATSRSRITVTSMGVSFCGTRPILDTTYGYLYARAKGVALAAASQVKRPAVQSHSKRAQAIIHSQWSRGYYHWLTESLPRALAAKRFDPNCIIMIPGSHGSFHPESLDLLGFDYDFFPSHNIAVETAVLTSCPKRYASTNSDVIIELSDQLKGHARSNIDYGEHLYISRRLARGRKVANEEAVCSMLAKYGFRCIVPEDHSFEEQVSMFSRAKRLVGIHGAGLTNMMFMRKGASVVELLPYRNGIFDLRPNSLSLKHDQCYRSLAVSLGHHHLALQCHHDKKFYERTHLANLAIDCVQLEELIRKTC